MDLSEGFYSSSAESTTSVDSTATATDATLSPPSPTLDQEITTVYNSLGSLWGNFRSKSITALASANQQFDVARKDLTPLVAKARTNLEKLGEVTKQELERLSEVSNSNTEGVMIGADGTPIITQSGTRTAEAIKKDEKGKGVDRSQHSPTSESNDFPLNPSLATASAFFSKLQSQIVASPNLIELQKNLNTLQHSVSTNLNTFPQSLQSNLHQLQDQIKGLDLHESTKLAETYLEKGENWFSEVSGEIAKLAKDAVKIVPPPGSAGAKGVAEGGKRATGRKDVLIQRLRENYSLLAVDPAQPPTDPTTSDLREQFSAFLAAVEESGGLEGDIFERRIAGELESAKGEGEKSLEENLKSFMGEGGLTKEAFWSRYFFRVGLIEQEEMARKQVLAVATVEDDFSWDMEEEEEETIAAPALRQPTISSPSTPISEHPPTPTTASAIADSTDLDTPKAKKNQRTRSPSSEDGDNDADAESNLQSRKSSLEIPSVDASPTANRIASTTPTTSQAATTTATGQATSTAPTSPRASSDGTSSYDVVSARSGNPSEAEHEKVPKEVSDEEDSDWE